MCSPRDLGKLPQHFGLWPDPTRYPHSTGTGAARAGRAFGRRLGPGGPGGAGWKIHATVATYGGETQRLRKMPQNWREI